MKQKFANTNFTDVTVQMIARAQNNINCKKTRYSFYTFYLKSEIKTPFGTFFLRDPYLNDSHKRVLA